MGCFSPTRSPQCQYLHSILRFEERQLVSAFIDVVKKKSSQLQTHIQAEPPPARLNQILGFIDSGGCIFICIRDLEQRSCD